MKSSGFGFFLVILFLVFDYARPQDALPFIGVLRPGLVLTGLMLVTWLRSSKSGTVSCPQLSLMLAFLILLAVHVPFAVNHFWAFQTTNEFLLLLPFCVSVILFVDTPKRVISFMRWWVALALYVAIKAILHPAAGAGSSFLADPNDVSLLLDMMLPFVLCMFIYEERRALKLTYLAISLVCLAAIVSTASRGGFLGLLAVMVVIWWVSPRKILALVVLIILGIGTYKFADQKYIDRISTIHETQEGTAKGRLDSWKAAWAMFKDHPLGVGPGNFPIRFPEYQAKSFSHNMWGRAAHSLWFTLLAELGIPGALLYALLLRANWRSIRHLNALPAESSQRHLAQLLSIAFASSLAGFFGAGTFLSVLFYPHYWFVTAIIVATDRSLTTATGPTESATLGPSLESAVPNGMSSR
jgi:putative inorganic carbon (hco3(-)) transporter